MAANLPISVSVEDVIATLTSGGNSVTGSMTGGAPIAGASSVPSASSDPLHLTMALRQLTIRDIINLDTPQHSATATPRAGAEEGEASAAKSASASAVAPASTSAVALETTGCCAGCPSSASAAAPAPEGAVTPAVAVGKALGISPATASVLNIKDGEEVDVNEHALQHYFVTRHPHRHCSVDELLAYNRKWSNYMNEHDPMYFKELAKHQAPKFLWIGCADSRVPANEILGLAPGDVFVHRNVANVVYPSDLNCLACIQFGVEHLKIEHLIISGHYECGGVKAAYYDLELGMVDNWVANIRDIKHRYWKLIEQVPEDQRVAVMCEVNAIVQARHVAESTVVQRWWSAYRKENNVATDFGSGLPVAEPPARADSDIIPSSPSMAINTHHNVVVHGWVYGLADGLIVPLVDIGPYDDVQSHCEDAILKCVAKRSPVVAEALRRQQEMKSLSS